MSVFVAGRLSGERTSMPTRDPIGGLRVHCEYIGNNYFKLRLYDGDKRIGGERTAIGRVQAISVAEHMKDQERHRRDTEKVPGSFWV